MQLYLMGYRGVGKTSVAERLSDRLQLPWVDADREVEQRAGRSIRQIFAAEGEPAFRQLEAEVIRDLAEGVTQIISLGGGAILREANREAIRRSGKVVWLRATPATVWARLQADPATAARRPNLTPAGGLAEIHQLLAERTPLYAECAHWTLDTDEQSPDAIADRIADWWRSQP